MKLTRQLLDDYTLSSAESKRIATSVSVLDESNYTIDYQQRCYRLRPDVAKVIAIKENLITLTLTMLITVPYIVA